LEAHSKFGNSGKSTQKIKFFIFICKGPISEAFVPFVFKKLSQVRFIDPMVSRYNGGFLMDHKSDKSEQKIGQVNFFFKRPSKMTIVPFVFFCV